MISATPDMLSDDQTLPRGKLHRLSCHEVFLTAEFATETGFRYVAQLPRSHFYYGNGSAGRRYDPLLLHEVSRQAAIALVAQTAPDNKHGQLMVTSSNLKVVSASALAVGAKPAHVEIFSEISRNVRQGEVRIKGSIDGKDSFETEFSGRDISQSAYARIRSQARMASCEAHTLQQVNGALCVPGDVGRADPRNVVIGVPRKANDGLVAQLYPDITHPAMFDHEVDHLPACLLLEAARQTVLAGVLQRYALAPSHALIIESNAHYERYAETAVPTEAEATISPPSLSEDGRSSVLSAQTQIRQHGNQVASIYLQVAYLGQED